MHLQTYKETYQIKRCPKLILPLQTNKSNSNIIKPWAHPKHPSIKSKTLTINRANCICKYQAIHRSSPTNSTPTAPVLVTCFQTESPSTTSLTSGTKSYLLPKRPSINSSIPKCNNSSPLTKASSALKTRSRNITIKIPGFWKLLVETKRIRLHQPLEIINQIKGHNHPNNTPSNLTPIKLKFKLRTSSAIVSLIPKFYKSLKDHLPKPWKPNSAQSRKSANQQSLLTFLMVMLKSLSFQKKSDKTCSNYKAGKSMGENQVNLTVKKAICWTFKDFRLFQICPKSTKSTKTVSMKKSSQICCWATRKI